MPASPMTFIWYELMTTDLDAAEAFYTSVVGWNVRRWDGPAAPEEGYRIVQAGEHGVAGLMKLPEQVRAAGGRPGWVGYIHAPDADAATAGIEAAGGRIHRQPTEIPDIGRFAVVADLQGATFMLLEPRGEAPPNAAQNTPGHIGWHELYAADWEPAFDFYAGQFGWTKDQAVDMGPMGTYQLFAAGGQAIGGMMNKPPFIPSPVWLYYFNVPAADAASARVTAAGGQIAHGPMEVPGGSWIVQAIDPQGAHFALVAPTR